MPLCRPRLRRDGGRSLAWLVTVYLGTRYHLHPHYVFYCPGRRQPGSHGPHPGLGLFSYQRRGHHRGFRHFRPCQMVASQRSVAGAAGRMGPWFRWPSGLTGLALAGDAAHRVGQRLVSAGIPAGRGLGNRYHPQRGRCRRPLLAVLLRTLLITLLIYGSLVRSLQDRSGLSMAGIIAGMIIVAFGLRYGAEVWHQCSDPSQAALALRFVAVRLLGWLLTGLGAAVAYKETAQSGPRSLHGAGVSAGGHSPAAVTFRLRAI